MILLNRYLFKQFTRDLLLVMAALITIYLLIDFFERMDDFFEAGKGFGLAAKYFLLKVPLIVEQLFPVIILLSGIIVLGILNHNGEILALKGVGIHTFRITVPITAAAVLFSLLTLAFAEWIVPPTLVHSNRILHEEVRGDKPLGLLRGDRYYYKDSSGFYSFTKFAEHNSRFDNFIFSSWDENYDLSMFLTADSGSWREGTWTFINCRIKRKDPDGAYRIENYTRKELSLTAVPMDFFVPEYRMDELSLSALYALSKTDRGTRGATAGFKLLERVSFILLGVPLLMLGLPLLLIAHQKWGRDLSLAVPLSCFLAFGAWGCWSVMQSLVKTTAVNPHIGAWSVHFLIAVAGTFLILQQDK